MPMTRWRGDRRRAVWLALATLPMLGLWAWPVRLPEVWAGVSYTQWHTLIELASVLVCGAITAVAWNARELEVPRSVHVLGSACAGALLLDLAHTLSFPGLPGLLGDNTPSRTVVLFMASRLLIALAMLCVAALPWQLDHEPRWARGAPAAVAAYVLGVLGWAFGAPETLPALVIDGQSLTFAKHAGEGLLVGLFLVASAMFARQRRTPQPFDVHSLLCAAVLMAIGEVVFTLYTRLTDLALIVGHVYKALGFWMVYRTIVADSIRAPYQRLLDSRQQLAHSEEELRTITDNIPAMVAFVDSEQRYRFVNRNYQRWLGMDPQAMLGRTALEVYGEAQYGSLYQPFIAEFRICS